MFSPSWFFDVSTAENRGYKNQVDTNDHVGILLRSPNHKVSISLTFQLAMNHAMRGETVAIFCNRMQMYNDPPCLSNPMHELDEATLSCIIFHYVQTLQEVRIQILAYLDMLKLGSSRIPSLFVMEDVDFLCFDGYEIDNSKKRLAPNAISIKAEAISLMNFLVVSLRSLRKNFIYFVACEKINVCDGVDTSRITPLSNLPCITHLAVVQSLLVPIESVLAEWKSTRYTVLNEDEGKQDVCLSSTYTFFFQKIRYFWRPGMSRKIRDTSCAPSNEFQAIFSLENHFVCISRLV